MPILPADYPPKASDEDEVGLEVGIAYDPHKNVMIIRFGKPIEWIAMPLDEAEEFGKLIIKHTREAKHARRN